MRIRLIASFFLIVLVTIGVFVIVTVRQNTQEVRNFVIRRGLTGSEEVVAALEAYYRIHGSWDGVADVLRKAPQVPRRGVLAPQAGVGQPWGMQAGRNNETGGMLSRMDLSLVDADGYVVATTAERSLLGRERLTRSELQRAVPLEVNGETIGYLLSQSGEVFTFAAQVSLLSRLNRAAFVAVVVAGLVALILALVLSFSLVRPVRSLQTAASRLATGDLSQRVQVKGKDELAELGRTFNHMAESLQDAENSRRAMTADIAHELRNPLAVQRAHLEAIEDGVYPLSAESLQVIEEQNRLLSRLVEDLRMLALADAGKLELQRTQVDLPELVRQVADRFMAQVNASEVDLILNLEACPPLLVDPQRIEQILHNLFSNALRHTPKLGEIQCRLWQADRLGYQRTGAASGNSSGGWVHLQIHDSGPGIPNEALPFVFDRFYRADKSRARVEGGTGLGLSIARKLAQTHNGSLIAANHPEGGAVFTLSLPANDGG